LGSPSPGSPIRTGKHPVVIASFDKDSARHVRSIEIPEVVLPKKLAIDGSGTLVIAGDDGRLDFGGETVLLRVSPDGNRVAQTALGSDAVFALAGRPEGNAVVVVGPPRHWSGGRPLRAGETRLLEVASDGRITASQPLDPSFHVIDLAVRPGGDVVLFGTKREDPGKSLAWLEVRGANGERRWSRGIRGGWSEAHAFAMESEGTLWVAAREDPQGGGQTPLALWKTTVRRLAPE
jgi:hypothetical protein